MSTAEPAPQPSTGLSPRGRLIALVGAVVIVVLVGVLILRGGGGGDDSPPAALSARLVPADALVYVHLSTDTGRRGTKAAEDLAEKFPGFADLRATLVKRLSAPGCKVPADALKKGKEVALALVDTGRGNAGSLVYVDTGDESKLPERTCGAIQTGKFGRFLVIGQPQSIVIARQLAAGKGKTLAADPRYRRELAKLPRGRVADLWVTKDGVQRLLAPQGGILGAAGTLLDQPGLIATAGAVTAADKGARVVLRTLKSGQGSDLPAFTPKLPDRVPQGTFAYLGLQGITGAGARLLGLAGAQTAGLAPLLAKAGTDLAPLLQLFSGEVAVTITPDTPAPVLSIITQAKDPAAAAATLAAARPKIARLLASSPSDVPEWKKLGDSYRLRPAAGVELDYKVVKDLVVVSTRQSGLVAVRDSKGPLSKTAGWKRSVGKTSNPVTSLVFLDFNQLLRLGEQTGLNDSRAYLAAKDDLQRLKSIGARSSSDGDESTVELLLSFP